MAIKPVQIKRARQSPRVKLYGFLQLLATTITPGQTETRKIYQQLTDNYKTDEQVKKVDEIRRESTKVPED